MSGRSSRPPDAFSASTIEMVCRELADAVTGGQIRNLIAPLRVSNGDDDERNTKWKRLFNAVVEAQNRQGDGRPLIRLITDVMDPVRFSSPAEFESVPRRSQRTAPALWVSGPRRWKGCSREGCNNAF